MAGHQGLISRFTPSRTSPEVLEAIFVQRHHLLSDTLERLQESINEASKHHFLFIGPRGSGKSHLIALIAHRLSQDSELSRHMCMAWLDEDETTTSYLDLLLRIHRALSQAYPCDFADDAIEAVYDLPEVEAAQYMQTHLEQQLGDRVLVVLVENLDKLFDGLGEEGQKRWRAFMQESGVFVTVATSQRLFDDIRVRSAPFFGQFQVEYLAPLKLGEAVELLRCISLYYEDQDLEAFLRTDRGRSRVEAVYHLSGGNHRVFIILSEFISREALDELVMAFDKLLDALTPYYQQRIEWLPAQQRKLVEYLCRSDSPVPVKDMSRRLFMSQQTASRQLKELRDKGYVISHSRGRESLYELAEPLMRLCVEVKENRRQPVRLVVRFLRVWYTDDELRRFEKSSVGASYIEAALSEKAGNNAAGLASKLGAQDAKQMMSQVIAIVEKHFVSNDFQAAIDELSNLIELSINKVEIGMALLSRGMSYGELGEAEQAISDYTLVVEMPDVPIKLKAQALFNRGMSYGELGEAEQAISDYTLVSEMPDVPMELKAQALFNRGVSYGELGESEQAISDYILVVEMPDVPANLKMQVLFNRGMSYGELGESEQAISDYTLVVEMPDTPVNLKMQALFNRGVSYDGLRNSKQAISDCTLVTEMLDVPVDLKVRALFIRGMSYGKLGQLEQAISDYTLVVEMPDIPLWFKAGALVNRGTTYNQLDNLEQTLSDYTLVLEMSDAPSECKVAALLNHARIHDQQDEHTEALLVLDRAIHLEPNLSSAQLFRVKILMSLEDWDEAFDSLEHTFKSFPPSTTGEAGDTSAMVCIISQQAASRWHQLVLNIIEVYRDADALEFLGKGLVASLGALKLPAESLVSWEQTWRDASSDLDAMRIPMRIFTVGIQYLQSVDQDGGDERLLYDLPMEEANILRDALGIESPNG